MIEAQRQQSLFKRLGAVLLLRLGPALGQILLGESVEQGARREFVRRCNRFVKGLGVGRCKVQRAQRGRTFKVQGPKWWRILKAQRTHVEHIGPCLEVGVIGLVDNVDRCDFMFFGGVFGSPLRNTQRHLIGFTQALKAFGIFIGPEGFQQPCIASLEGARISVFGQFQHRPAIHVAAP